MSYLNHLYAGLFLRSANHWSTLLVLCHWLNFDFNLISLWMVFRMVLLIFPICGLAGLISRAGFLVTSRDLKFSFVSLSVINAVSYEWMGTMLSIFRRTFPGFSVYFFQIIQTGFLVFICDIISDQFDPISWCHLVVSFCLITRNQYFVWLLYFTDDFFQFQLEVATNHLEFNMSEEV